MSPIKRITLWSFALLLLSGAVVAVFLATAGDGFYRWAATQLVERSIDRKVHVDGTFSFHVGLEPTLVITEVWIENAPWAEKKEMGRAEYIEVQIDLKSLVRGIVMLPRLVVEGVTLGLERAPDGKRNWDVAKASGKSEDIAGRKDMFIPVLGFISVKDITIDYTDRESGRDTEIVVKSLQKDPVASQDNSPAIQGQGSINREKFQIKGRFGSIEDALAAKTPYPVELTLETLGLVAELTGTVRNLAEAQGFDLSLTARAPSIGQVLKTWETDLALQGSASGSARLRGNLESLSVEDVVLAVVEHSRQVLRIEGSVSDLLHRKGLDLRFSAHLGPEALLATRRLLSDLPPDLGDILHGATGLEIGGRIRGDAETPALEKLQAQLQHRSGANLSLDGHAALDLSEDHVTLTGLGATSTLYLPGPALLAQALDKPLPDLGAIRASAELSFAENWITLGSFRAQAASFAGLQLGAAGRIGKLSGEALDLALEPQLDLSASMKQSRPLIALLVADKIDAGDDLVLLIQQGLKSVGLHPGPADGKMGPHTRAAIEAYQAQQGLAVDGQATRALLRHLQRTSLATQDDTKETGGNVVLLIQQGLKSAGLHPGPADGKLGPHTRAAIEAYQAQHHLAVTGQTGQALLQHLRRELDPERPQTASEADNARPQTSAGTELSLPELGPVMASGRLSGREGSYRLDDLKLTLGETAGAADKLAVHIVGDIGDLLAMKHVELEVDLDLPSSNLLDASLPDLGAVSARAKLSGSSKRAKLEVEEITVGERSSLLVQAQGSLDIAGTNEGLGLASSDLNIRAEAASTQGVAELFQQRWPDLGAVTAKGRLSDRKGRLSLDDLKLQVAKEGYLALEASGAVGDVLRGDLLDLTLVFSSPDPQKVAALLEQNIGRLPPLKGTGRLTGGREQASYNGTLTLGQTELVIDLAGNQSGKRPSITGTIDTPVLHLADIGIAPKPARAEAGRQKASTRNSGGPIFSKAPFDTSGLREVDLSLVVRLDQIEGVNLFIDKADVTVKLQEGNLRIHPARVVFEGGEVSIDFGLNEKNTPSTFLKVTGDDVQVGPVLAQVASQVPIEGGLLNLYVDLLSHGDSPHELASKLNGRVGLAMESARIKRNLVELLALDIFRWTIHSVIDRDRYIPLDCMILRTTVTNGTLTIDELFTKGRYLRMRGKGAVDLNAETLHMTLYPKKQGDFFRVVTPVRIQGDLESPSISAIPYREVALIGGMAVVGGVSISSPEVFVPALALDYLWKHLKNKNRKSPCLAEESGGGAKSSSDGSGVLHELISLH